jgi:voltage-gated potassium channel
MRGDNARGNRVSVGDETQVERRLERALERATTPRRAAAIIAIVTTALTVLSGLLMTVIDHRDFSSAGGGLWWAVQTVTTVGYGDLVPTNVAGRVVATVIMLFGIGFLTVVTAAITSSFVTRSRGTRVRPHDELPPTEAEALDEIVERLRRIEAALIERP